MAGRYLSAQISLALLRCTHVVQEHRQNVLISNSRNEKLHGRNADSFLIDLAAKSHGAGVSATDIGVMGSRGDVELSLASAPSGVTYENRRYQGDVGEMSPATEWVIQHDDVAIVNRAGFDGGGDRHRHRSQMHRHVIAHGDYLAFAV